MVHANDYITRDDAEKLNFLVDKANSHFGSGTFEIENEDEESDFVKVLAFGEEQQATFNDLCSVYSFFCGVCFAVGAGK